jgi:hypothetical protein
MVDDLKFWTVYAILVVAVLIVGWRQPLRYRFMSKQEIAQLEAPKIEAQPTPWMWDTKRATKLDNGPYRDRSTERRAMYYFSR